MRKLVMTIEVNVRDLTDAELELCQLSREEADDLAEEVDAPEMGAIAASMFAEGSEAVEEAFAGSNVFLKFAGATVHSAELFTVKELED